MAGVALETQILELRRQVSRQYYRTDVLIELHARLRLKTQQLAAPGRLIETIRETGSLLKTPRAAASHPRQRLPLLRWQQPATNVR